MTQATDVAVRSNGRELASYDAEAGSIVVPTQVSGVHMTFRPDQTAMSEQQMVLLSPLGVEATWDPRQVAVFLMECQERGLNPWNREAYLMRYRDARAPDGHRYIRHIGIDGFRKRGESTGQYRGRVGPFWCDTDGTWLEFWPYKDRPPVAAKVGLNRAGFDDVVWAVAMYDEYVATKPVWRDGKKTDEREVIEQWRPAAQQGKPAIMLAKVAEAQAWRVAFPERFGGFYAPEEFERDRMQQQQRGEDPSATKRREAYAAAQATQPGAVVDGDVAAEPESEQPTVPDNARDLLLIELDEQAEVLGKTTEQLCERWSATRDGRPITDATVEELMAHVHAIRPYVATALREQKRDEEAARYEQAPQLGTSEELFGRGPQVPDGPPEPEVAEQ